VASGTLVFIAPDGPDTEGLARLATIRPDDQSPRDVFYTPPDPPPQSALST